VNPAWVAIGLAAAGLAALVYATPRAGAAENEPAGHRAWQIWECHPNAGCRMRGRPLGKTACLLDLADLTMKVADGSRWACVSIEEREDEAMIEIDGRLVNPAHIVSAEIETRHYVNGSASKLVVTLDNGQRIEREHGFGFDVYAALDKIRGRHG
jgi:hypothetical protein